MYINLFRSFADNIVPSYLQTTYLISYRKDHTGKYFRRSKSHVTWEVVIEGTKKTFELSHSQISGKKTVWVDGERIFKKDGIKEFIDVGLNWTYPEKVNGRSVRWTIVDFE